MTIPVGRLAPGDQWDCNMLDLLWSNKLYPTGLDFKQHQGFPPHHQASGCILQVPGRYWHRQTDQITEAIARYSWVLLVRTSDEEDQFDIGTIDHPNIRFWVQTPRHGRDYGDARLFGVGFPPHFNDLQTEPPVREIGVFLSAQNTHIRRTECFAALENVEGTKLVVETSGFTRGASPDVYAEDMVDAKVAPCPSGAVSCDSFRLWEALESHAIPVADTVSPVDGETDYFMRIFSGEYPPFPILRDYKHLKVIVEGLLDGWPANNNRVTAWWCRQKREMTLALKADLQELGAL